MPYVIKTAPFSAAAGSSATLEELALYGGGQIATGDEVFIWFSETQGGGGLAWRATVTRRIAASNRKVSVVVGLTEAAPLGALGIKELEPLRVSREADGLSGVSRKLYRHAHNKCAALTEVEAAELRRRFSS